MYISAIGVDSATVEFLERRGIRVEQNRDLRGVLAISARLTRRPFDVALIDLETSGVGVEDVEQLCGSGVTIPIVGIFRPPEDKNLKWPEIEAVFLNAGCSHIIRWPLFASLLEAYIRAAFRSGASPAHPSIGVTLDDTERHATIHLMGAVRGFYLENGTRLLIDTVDQVVVNDRLVALTPQEKKLLLFLAESPGILIPKAETLKHLEMTNDTSLRVLVHKLREKFKIYSAIPGAAKLITSKWGKGLRLEGYVPPAPSKAAEPVLGKPVALM